MEVLPVVSSCYIMRHGNTRVSVCELVALPLLVLTQLQELEMILKLQMQVTTMNFSINARSRPLCLATLVLLEKPAGSVIKPVV